MLGLWLLLLPLVLGNHEEIALHEFWLQAVSASRREESPVFTRGVQVELLLRAWDANPGMSKSALEALYNLQNACYINPVEDEEPPHWDTVLRRLRKEKGLFEKYDVCPCQGDRACYFGERSHNNFCVDCDAPRAKALKSRIANVSLVLNALLMKKDVSDDFALQKLKFYATKAEMEKKKFKQADNWHDIADSPMFNNYIRATEWEKLQTSKCIGITADGIPAKGAQHGRGRQYTFTLVSGELLDLSRKHRISDASRLMLAVLPGPSEPANMTPWLEPLMHQFRSLDLYCGYVVADTPAMTKLLRGAGHSGYNGCLYCWKRPKYKHGRFDWCSDRRPVRKKTSAEYKYFGAQKVHGFHGVSPLFLWDHNPVDRCWPDGMHILKNLIACVFVPLLEGSRDVSPLSVAKFVSSKAARKLRKDGNYQGYKELRAKEKLAYKLKKRQIKDANLQRACNNTLMRSWKLQKSSMEACNADWGRFCVESNHYCTAFPLGSSKGKMSTDDWIKWIKNAAPSVCKQLQSKTDKNAKMFNQRAKNAKTFQAFCEFVILLDNEDEVSTEVMDELWERLDELYTLMEETIDVSARTLQFHYLEHLLEGMEELGSIRGSWCFRGERAGGRLAKKIRAFKHIEAHIVRQIEMSSFCRQAAGISQMADEYLLELERICAGRCDMMIRRLFNSLKFVAPFPD